MFRHQAGEITARLVTALGWQHLDLIEDVVQDALEKALRVWPFRGVPEQPSSWLTTVARNAALDRLRRERSWDQRLPQVEAHFARWQADQTVDERFIEELSDDQLRMIFICCHPSLSNAARVCLTLKTVGGFSTAEIGSGLLLREATVAQRIVRAKRRLRQQHIALELPPADQLAQRLDSVLQVIYLMFNEGHTASQGEQLLRLDLCHEAIRLLRLLVNHPLGDQPRAHALLAMMLFHAARFPARTNSVGELVLLADQDRSRWEPALIADGFRSLHQAASGTELSRYHIEAEISACHALAKNIESTDWSRIVICYDRLIALRPSLVLTVNRAAALFHLDGVQAAWESLSTVATEGWDFGYIPFHVVCATLLEELGQTETARRHWARAKDLSQNAASGRYLAEREQHLRAI